MNSEKQVKDLTKEAREKITEQKEKSISNRLINLVEKTSDIENRIKELQELLVKNNAEITKFEGLTVEEAYELIQKDCSVSIGYNGFNTTLCGSGSTYYTTGR